MSVQNKPDYKIFADGAKPGEVVVFPDVLRGWGVTLDTTGGIPPMEFFNSFGKRLNEWLMYLTQRGIPEWDTIVDYPKDAMTQHAGVYYVSLKATKGEQPNNSQSSWRKLTEALGVDGKLSKEQNGADIPNKDTFIKNLGLPEKYLSLSGGAINGRLKINSTWGILDINSLNKEGALIKFGESSGSVETAQIGFASEDSKYFRISNEKTGTVLHILNGYAQIDGKKVLTVDDANSIVPIGATIIWNSSVPYPDNFWPNDGRSFSASGYPELAKVFPNLKLPDDRGYAIRAADGGKGIDTGRAVGTYQEDAIRNIYGGFGARGNGTYEISGAMKIHTNTNWQVNDFAGMPDGGNRRGVTVYMDASTIVPTASENRMKNVAKILITRVK